MQRALSRTGGSNAQALTVFYSLGGSATNGQDYTAPSGSMTIAAGSSFGSLVINTIADQIDDPGTTETVLVTLSTSSGYALGAAKQATGTINDTSLPPPPSLQSVTISGAPVVSEGGQLVYTVSRAGGSTAQALTVFYTLGGSATSGQDYTAPAGSVTIAAGNSTATLAINTIADQVDDPGATETVLVTLSSSSGYALGAATQATGTINDTSLPPPPSLQSVTISGAPVVNEGGQLVYTVARAGGSTAQALTVFYSVGGSATSGQDYTAPAGSVTIAAGNSTATLAINTIADQIDDPGTTETVLVTLSSSSGYALGATTQATGTINDTSLPSAPSLQSVTISGAPVVNEGGQLVYTVARAGGSTAQALTVFYSVGGSATSGQDYTAPAGSVTIAAGNSTATLAISTIADQIDDPGMTETVLVTLSSSSGYALGATTQATGTINDTSLPSSVDGAGNTLAAARLVTLGTGLVKSTDFVGPSDTNDYYKFVTTKSTDVALSLAGLSADADVKLLNSSGAELYRSDKGGSAAELISVDNLAAGTYYVQVYPFNSASTDYTLTIMADEWSRPVGISNRPFSNALVVTQGYGGDTSHSTPQFSYSIDLRASSGTPVLALADGIVVGLRADAPNAVDDTHGAIGNFVTILHSGGFYASYGHLSVPAVTLGQAVTAGANIGTSGRSGTTDEHLHISFGTDITDDGTMDRANGSLSSGSPAFFSEFFQSTSELGGILTMANLTGGQGLLSTDIFGTTDATDATSATQTKSALQRGVNADEDELNGGSDNNRIFASSGNDWLDGKGGNDTLVGGSGNDTLVGGSGADTFVELIGSVGQPSTTRFDTIKDFTPTSLAASSDVLKLSNVAILSALTGWTVSQGIVTKSGATVASFIAAMANKNAVAAFSDGSNTWVYDSVSVSNTTNDVLVELVGVNYLTTLSTSLYGSTILHLVP